MDISKPPDSSDIRAASGVWNWLIFFFGLLFSGGLAEYWINSRYVTRKELATMQANCNQDIQYRLEIALMKRDEALEEKIIKAISASIREELGKK